MKAFSKRISLYITLAVLALFAFYFALNIEKFKPLLHVNYLLLLIIAIADLASIVVSGFFTKFILRPFKKFIPILESFYVSLISSVGNFFAPAGAGFGFRAVYLKRKYDFPYTEYVSTLSGNYILVFLVNSFFGLLALYVLRDKSNSQYKVLLAIFAVIFVTSLILSLIKIPIKSVEGVRNKKLRRISMLFYRVTNGWNYIVSHRGLMARLAILTSINLFITIFITWVIIQALHLSIGFAPLLLFSVLGSLSLFINITPANLGVKEAIYLFSASILGFSTTQILSIALIDRGVLFIVLLVLWLLSSRVRDRVGVNSKAYEEAIK